MALTPPSSSGLTRAIDEAIDTERGTIGREIFVSPECHCAELEKHRTRAWLFVGHESRIPNPRDFFVARTAEESVIFYRTYARDPKGDGWDSLLGRDPQPIQRAAE